jgi:predicted Zn-dependent protease with MMP-like domain
MHSDDDIFGTAVEQAIASIPDHFRPYLENVIIEVQSQPNAQLLDSLGLPPDRSLLGLYVGRPITRKSVEESAVMPDRILLFRRNIERSCRTRTELIHEIRKTLLHEVGHHFGFDEDELDALGYG